jgi:hypothetical protein
LPGPTLTFRVLICRIAGTDPDLLTFLTFPPDRP